MKPLVSVIIPVYNSETYIEECIQSLLSQTLKNCEFIFVNDGSIDNSKDIIESYKSIDYRIKLINQENQGVSSARNNGINNAIGEFIGFVDSDDYVDEDMYETLYKSIKHNNSDLIVSNWEVELDGKKISMKYNFPKNEVMDKAFINNKIIPYFLEKEDMNTVCNKLYKNSIIKSKNIKFPNGVALGEDGIFNIKYLDNAETMEYIDYSGYHYREVEGSATRDILNKDYFKRSLEIYKYDINNICKLHINKNDFEILKSIKFIESVISYIYIYFTSTQIESKDKFILIKDMISNKDVQYALKIYKDNNFNINRYKRLIIKMIKIKSIFGLYMLTKYSQWRSS